MPDEELIIHDAGDEEEAAGLPGCPFWMVTFGDVVSLLLTFFVLILSFSEISPAKSSKLEFFEGGGGGDEFRATSGIGGDGAISASDDLSDAQGGEQDSKFKHVEKKVNAEALALEESNEKNIRYSMASVSDYLNSESNSLTKQAVHVKKSQSGGGFKLSIDQAFAFVVGTARFKAESQENLAKIAHFIAELPNDIIISCTANDFNRIAYPLYPSNQNLSIARSNAVAEFLIHAWKIAPERIGIRIEDDAKDNGIDSIINNSTVETELSIEIVSEFNGFIRNELKNHDPI
jgi:chemotaxis protein MotB